MVKEKKADKTNRVPFHIMVDEDIYSILKDYCKAENKKLRDIVNVALDKFLNETKINPIFY